MQSEYLGLQLVRAPFGSQILSDPQERQESAVSPHQLASHSLYLKEQHPSPDEIGGVGAGVTATTTGAGVGDVVTTVEDVGAGVGDEVSTVEDVGRGVGDKVSTIAPVGAGVGGKVAFRVGGEVVDGEGPPGTILTSMQFQNCSGCPAPMFERFS